MKSSQCSLSSSRDRRRWWWATTAIIGLLGSFVAPRVEADLVPGPPIPVPTSVAIASTKTTLTTSGETASLTVTARFAGGSSEDVTGAGMGTIYGSRDPAVAEVTEGGLVTARSKGSTTIFANFRGILGSIDIVVDIPNPLGEDCTASVLNRSVQVSADGTFAIPNVPATSGLIRIRVTCDRDGKFFAGHSGLLTPIQNADTVVGGIELQEIEPIPVNIKLSSPQTTFATAGETAQLAVQGTLPDGSIRDYTARSTGTTYQSSNPNLGTVSEEGLYTAQANGTVVVTARNEGAITTIFLTNALGDDADADGLPDDFERQNGLDPSLAADAAADADFDGLSNRDEFLAGTELRVRDTDGDGLLDGDEVGRGSNPLVADTDGDGLLDRDEVLRGTDPRSRDTDADGIPDGTEVAVGLNPLAGDSDNDGTLDSAEDTDGDGIRNEDELIEFTGVGDPDTDDDGIADGEEVVAGADGFVTDPLNADTDRDGMRDGCETSCAGLSPRDPADAAGDLDADGLTNLQECRGGTSPCQATDVSGPKVTSVTPADGAAEVATNADVVLVFDEAVSPSTVTAANFVLFAGTTRLSPSLIRSPDNRTITLRGGLQAGTAHSLFVSGRITDLQGNRGPDFASTFTTGAPPDTARPQVAAVRPASGASGVSVAKCVTVFFSEPISAASITGASFRLMQGANPIAATAAVDPEGTSATLCPDALLAFNTTFTVSLTASVEDAAGNDLQPFSASFTTGADPGATRPSVVSIRPASGQQEVPTNAPVLALFSEPVNPATVNGTSFAVSVAGGAAIAGTVTVEENDTVARFTPSAPYPASTNINVRLLSAITDAAGNALLNQQNFNFRTAAGPDAGAPQVAARTPPEGGTGLGTNAVVTVRFSEPVNPVSVHAGSLQVRDDEGALVPCTITFSRGDAVVTFASQDPLDPGTAHTVSLTDRIIDLGGNAIAPATWTFTTGSGADVAFPQVVSVNPINGATGVPTNTRIALLFTRPVSPVTLDATGIVIQGSAPVAGAFTTNASRTLVSFAPAGLLEANRGHSVRAARLEIVDDSGNRLNGGASDFFAGFTTGEAPDMAGPRVVAVNPPDGLPQVGANAPVVLQFSEAVDVTSIGPATLRILRGGVPVAGTYTPSADLDEITFRPEAMLAVNSLYTVDLLAGAYFDVAGNAGSGFASTFATGGAVDLDFPVVVRVSPANGAQDVPTNAPVVVEFSEPVNPILVTAANFFVSASGLGTVPGSIAISADRTRATFTPAMPYPVAANHTVRVRRDVTDDAGNRLLNGSDFTSSFSTRFVTDATPPGIASTSPASGDVLVPLNAGIHVQLSEPIDTTTITPVSFAVSAGGQQVAGAFSFGELDSLVTFDPDAELPSSSEVRVVLSGIRDLAGNALPGGFVLSFRTGTGVDTVSPAVVFTNPLQEAMDVPLDAAVGLTFSESMNEASIDPSTLRLTGSGAPPVVYTVSFDRGSGRKATIVPDRPLLPFVRYNVSATANIVDRAGNRLGNGGGHFFSFTTGRQGDAAGPNVVATSPADGATGVGANTPVVVEFDEPVDPNTVTNSTFLVRGGLVEILGGFEVSQTGRVATLKPFTFLRTGIEHEVRLDGITDVSGNAMAPYTFRFTTVDRGNLARTPGVLVNTSSQFSASFPGTALIDGNLNSSWFTANNDPAPSVEITFLEDVTVLGVNVLNPRSNPTGFDFLTAQVKLLAGDLSVIHDSGVFALDQGGFQDKALVVPETAAVRRVRFEGLTWQSIEPGLAEIQVIGRFGDPGKGVPDLEQPMVTAFEPANGATGVPVTAAPRVTFSRAMNPITFTDENCFLSVSGVGLYPAVTSFDASARLATLTPAVRLPADATVSIVVQGTVTDANGNRLAFGSSSSFRTAATADGSPPAIVSVDPVDGATGVSLNQLVTLRFSEPLSPPTVNADSFAVYGSGARTFVSIQRSADSTAVVLDGNWEPGTLHVVYVSSGAADLGGNPLPAYSSRFTTGGRLDITAPRVVISRPASGSTVVPRNHGAHLFLSEPADPGTLAGGFFLSQAANEGGQLVAGARSLSYGNLVASFAPQGLLDFDTGHVVSLRPEVRDAAGNPLSAFSASFTTVEDPSGVGPAAVAVNPPSGTGGVPVNVKVRVRFSEPVDRATITPSSFFVTPSGAGAVAGSFAFEQGDTVVAFSPGAPLTASLGHTISVRTGIRDLAGTPLRGNVNFSFTTGTASDAAAPAVALVSPPGGATAIGVNAPVLVQFTEPVDPITVGPESFRLLGPSGPVEPCALFFSSDNRIATLVPHAPLEPDAEYTVSVTAGVLDAGGNALSPPFTSGFRTSSAPELAAPQVTAISIENGASGVPINSAVVVELSEPVNPITVTGENCFLTASGFGQLPGALSLSADRRRVTMTPAMTMPVSRSVSVRIRSAVLDDHGNRLSDGNDFFSSFTTEFLPDSTPPVVAAVSPPGSTAGAPINTRVMIGFSEPMDRVSFAPGALAVRAGGGPLDGTVTLAAGNTQAVWSPRLPLAPDTVHSISLAGSVRDAAGNALGSALSSTFTTGSAVDLTPPASVSLSPPNGAEAVPTDAVIHIRFSERLNPATVNDSSFNLSGSGVGAVPVTVTLDDTLMALTVTPVEPLRGLTFHSISGGAGVQDFAGNPLGALFLSFTTGATASSPGAPAVTRVHPANGAVAAPSNAAVTLEFDREIDFLTVSASAFRVRAAGSDVPGTYAVDGALRRVTFKPTGLYPTGSTVSIAASGIADLSGTPMAAPFASQFTAIASGNLTQVPGIAVNASSQFSSSFPAANAIDGRLDTSWFTACGDSANQGGSPFLEILLPEEAAVSEIRMFGLRSHPNGFDFFSGIFQLFSAGGAELYSSGDLPLPAPDRDLALSFAEVSGVRRARFTATADQSCEPGLGELEVIGRFESGLGIPDRLAPVVSASTPADGASSVSTGTAIAVTFSEPVNPISLEGNVVLTASGAGTVPGAVSLNAARTILSFTPSLALRPSTFHAFALRREIVDDAGHQLGGGSGRTLTFTTGTGAADAQAPSVVSITPPDGAAGVYRNQPISIVFSEHIATGVGRDFFAVYAGGERLSPSVSRDASGLAVNLTTTWPNDQQVIVVVSSDVTDLAGNPLGDDFVSSFTVGSAADNTSPRVDSLRPASGAGDVPVAKDIVLILSEPVRAASVADSVFLAGPDGKLVAISTRLEGDGTVLVIDPAASLVHDGAHTVYATPDLQDLAGNAFQTFSGTFRTAVDPAAAGPSVVAVHPPSGLANVALDAVITIRFSEPVNPATITTSTITLTPNGLPALTGAFGFDEGNTLVRFTPSADMTASRSHTIRILTGVQDAGGSPLASALATAFTTGTGTDADPPAVLALSPVHGQTGIGVNAIASVRFSEPVNAVTLSSATFRLSTAGGDRVPCSLFFEEGNLVAHLIPSDPLAPAAAHTLTIESTVADAAGNFLGADATSTFTTTTGTRLGGPQVLHFTPLQSQTNVPANVVLRALVSEPLSPVNVSDDAVRLSASGLGAVAGTVGLSADRRLITFTPAAPLSPSRIHSFFIDREVRDAEGNLFRDGNGEAMSFTTGAAGDAAAPAVTATSPEHGAAAVPRNALIAVEFNETVDLASLTHAQIDLERGGADVAGGFQFSSEGRIAHFLPSALLAAGAAHRLTIGGVRDLAGNILAGPVVIDFTTGTASDLVFPTVTTVTPANGATGVARSTTVTIQFSEAISPVNVNPATVRLIESGVGDVSTSIAIAADRRSLTITPASQLTASRFYAISLSNGITDRAGNELGFSSSGFTTGP